MTSTVRKSILRANAIFLMVAACGGLIKDITGTFLLHGPMSRVLERAPHAAIGFVEAHGLALIVGVLLWRAEPVRQWHLTAAAVHVLLGTANLVFWPLFMAADMLVVGWLTTLLHWCFAVVQGAAATSSRPMVAGPI